MLVAGHARHIIALICAAILVPAATSFAFPLNGSLERSYRGTPFGWEETGSWSFYPVQSYEGRGHFILRQRWAEPGAELLSRSFRLISPGDTLVLRCAYKSSAEGLSVGLVFVDALGRQVGDRWGCPLPAADEWTQFETELQMDPLAIPDGAVGAKVSVLVDAEDIQVEVDAVELQGPTTAPMDPSRSAPIPAHPWQPHDLLGPVSAELTIEPEMCEPNTEEPVRQMWLSSPLTVHGTYPHRAVADVELTGDPGAEATLILRAVGEDAADVLWQEIQPIPSECDGPVSVEIPAPYIESNYVDLQVGLALSATAPATASVVDCDLLAIPFSVDLHGVQRKSTFASPAEAQVFVSAVNNVGAELTTQALISVADEDGATVHREQRSIRIRGRSAASFPVKPKLRSAGDYTLHVSFMLGTDEIGAGDFEFTVEDGG